MTKGNSPGYTLVDLIRTNIYGLWWDREGRCFQGDKDIPDIRRPECDYGTPLGDLLVDPWMQKVKKRGFPL